MWTFVKKFIRNLDERKSNEFMWKNCHRFLNGRKTNKKREAEKSFKLENKKGEKRKSYDRQRKKKHNKQVNN